MNGNKKYEANGPDKRTMKGQTHGHTRTHAVAHTCSPSRLRPGRDKNRKRVTDWNFDMALQRQSCFTLVFLPGWSYVAEYQWKPKAGKENCHFSYNWNHLSPKSFCGRLCSMADFTTFRLIAQIERRRGLSCYPRLLLSHLETLWGVQNINLVCIYDLCCSQLSVKMPYLPPPPLPDLVGTRSEGFKYWCHANVLLATFPNQPERLRWGEAGSKGSLTENMNHTDKKVETWTDADGILLSLGFVVFSHDGLSFTRVIDWDYSFGVANCHLTTVCSHYQIWSANAVWQRIKWEFK